MKEQRIQRSFVVCLFAAILMSGCASTMRNRSLEKVAKDWAMVIRASQVIPVYPLTEDLQPGDVLLVSTPVEQQSEIYRKKGFLPLDQHLIRFYPDGMVDFYRKRYGVTGDSVPPENWQTGVAGWSNAPACAFPAYNFSVSAKSGIGLAFPVQGVPVALGLMNSGSASGSLLINNAYTYGIDNFHLEKQVREWADTNRPLLSNYAPDPEKPKRKKYQFLRVVTRVYVAEKVDVSIVNDNANSGDLGVGGGGVDLGSLDKAGAITNLVAAVLAADSLVPGGNVKFNTVSHRAVSLKEKFNKPLVIGYAGFDLPILEGGRLGAPISTLTQLEGNYAAVSFSPVGTAYQRAALAMVYDALVKDESARATEIKKQLDSLAGSVLPSSYEFTVYQLSDSQLKEGKNKKGDTTAREPGNPFRNLIGYLTNAENTQKVICDARQEDSEPYKTNIAAARKAASGLEKKILGASVLAQAVDYVFFGK